MSNSTHSVYRHRAAIKAGLVQAPRGYIHPDDYDTALAMVLNGERMLPSELAKSVDEVRK